MAVWMICFFLMSIPPPAVSAWSPQPNTPRARYPAELNRRTSTHRRIRQTCAFVSLDDSSYGSGSNEDTTQQHDDAEDSSVSSRMHQDMRRVLESHHRRQQQHAFYPTTTDDRPNNNNSNDMIERRIRPAILESDVDGAERVHSMLQHMQQTGTAVPESYQICMQAFLKRGRLRWHNGTTIICAADQLEVLLEQLLVGQHSTTTTATIDWTIYNLVLEAYAVCATPRGARNYAGRAHALLERLQAVFGKDAVPVESVVHVLRAYSWQQANLQPGDCAIAAHRLLDRVVTAVSDDDDNDPGTLMKCYGWVLEAWSKSGSAGSAEKAHEIFQQMLRLNQTLSDNDPAGQIVDAETYCNCILAWSKTTENGGAEKAHEILLSMLDKYRRGAFPAGSEPSLIAFNGVISAWARQGRAEKAQEVLFLMDKIRSTCERLVPDAVSYNSVIYAHLRSPDKEEALKNALSLVQYMEDHQEEQPAIKPNCFSYQVLMKCWIQSGRPDMAEQAEQTLRQMERLWEKGDTSLMPNNRIFNMVINAYAKSNDRYVSRKAYSILERMKLSKGCQPDVISYTSVMECLSKSADPDAPTQAEALLAEAFTRYNTTGNPRDRPNLRTFTMAIQTLAKSHGSVVRGEW